MITMMKTKMLKRLLLEIGKLLTFQNKIVWEMVRSSKMKSLNSDPRFRGSMINNGNREELEKSKFSSTKIAAKLDYYAEEKRLTNAYLITTP
jgi:hypothetical protein